MSDEAKLSADRKWGAGQNLYKTRCSTRALHLLPALVPIGSIAYVVTMLMGVRLRIWSDFLEAIRRLLPERLRGLLPV
jgi:hypothetical protein